MATYPTVPGFPDSSNTGVPAGVALKASGSITISTPGAVVSGLDIKGTVTITAANVTLQNCRITSSEYALVKVKAGVTGVVVQNNEINGVGTGNDGNHGIMGSGTFAKNNIYNVENGITLDGGAATTIKDNYVHGLKASGSPHYDGIQIDGGISNVLIQHNTIINDYNQTAAIMIDNYFGPISNIKVDGNYLAGGGYTVYSDGQFSGGSITGVSFTNNYMGKGAWGYESAPNNNPTWTGNIDVATNRYVDDGGTLGALAPAYSAPVEPAAPVEPVAPLAPVEPAADGATLTGSNGYDSLYGTSNNDTLSGLGGNDKLTGNAGNDKLYGGSGYDKLYGGAGDDSLYGGDGNDLISGGTGADDLFGGAGADVFDFNAANESSVGGGLRDLVHDFQRGSDKIDLAGIDAKTSLSGDQAFAFLGQGTFSSTVTTPGQLKYHYETVNGEARTVVEGTTNSTAGIDFQISLVGTHALSASDFLL